MTRGGKASRTARLALPALALASVLAALSAAPIAHPPRLGAPEPALWHPPPAERPVPDRPERPMVPTAPAILSRDGTPPAAPAVPIPRPVSTDGEREGFRARIERPPIA